MSIQITREHLQKLAAADETRLRTIIYETARQTGAGELSARIASANTRLIKSRLLSASEEEIKNIVNAVGEDWARQMIAQIEKL